MKSGTECVPSTGEIKEFLHSESEDEYKKIMNEYLKEISNNMIEENYIHYFEKENITIAGYIFSDDNQVKYDEILTKVQKIEESKKQIQVSAYKGKFLDIDSKIKEENNLQRDLEKSISWKKKLLRQIEHLLNNTSMNHLIFSIDDIKYNPDNYIPTLLIGQALMNENLEECIQKMPISCYRCMVENWILIYTLLIGGRNLSKKVYKWISEEIDDKSLGTLINELNQEFNLKENQDLHEIFPFAIQLFHLLLDKKNQCESFQSIINYVCENDSYLVPDFIDIIKTTELNPQEEDKNNENKLFICKKKEEPLIESSYIINQNEKIHKPISPSLQLKQYILESKIHESNFYQLIKRENLKDISINISKGNIIHKNTDKIIKEETEKLVLNNRYENQSNDRLVDALQSHFEKIIYLINNYSDIKISNNQIEIEHIRSIAKLIGQEIENCYRNDKVVIEDYIYKINEILTLSKVFSSISNNKDKDSKNIINNNEMEERINLENSRKNKDNSLVKYEKSSINSIPILNNYLSNKEIKKESFCQNRAIKDQNEETSLSDVSKESIDLKHCDKEFKEGISSVTDLNNETISNVLSRHNKYSCSI